MLKFDIPLKQTYLLNLLIAKYIIPVALPSIPSCWNTTTFHSSHNIHSLNFTRSGNFAICSNMDGRGGHYAKWNKSERERHVVWYHLYVESKKCNKLVNKTKNKQTHR